MAHVNAQTRGRSGPTTVLAFPFTPERDGVDVIGEILLCLPAIRTWARADGQTFRTAVPALFVHGLAHLAGHDHHTVSAERRMRTVEQQILSRSTHAR